MEALAAKVAKEDEEIRKQIEKDNKIKEWRKDKSELERFR